MKEVTPFYKTIADAMSKANKRLAADPETRDRFGNATQGGKSWMCYTKWVGEDGTRWDNEDATRYRELLAAWLTVTDLSYVLQFETDPRIVDFLKKQLLSALERETSPDRLKKKQDLLTMGLNRKTYDGRTVSTIAQERAGCGNMCRNMRISAMREVAAFLKGESFGAGYWAHPDHSKYLAWHNQYLAPLTGLIKVR